MPLIKNRAYNPALGVRQRKQLTVNFPALPPGFTIRATDRNYVIQRNGSYVRQDRDEQIPHNRSMIYLAHPPRPDRADQWRADKKADAIVFTTAR